MEYVKLRLESDFDGKGFKAADAAVERSRDALGRFTKSANEARQSLSWGDGLKLGLGDRAISALAQIPAVLEQGVRSGVMFNAKMADSEVAIANVVQQFGGLNKEAARNQAAAAMQQIVDLEPKTAATLDGLVQGFMATLASSQSAGLSVEQNIDLVGKFANALANANIPAEQLSQELRSIFSGNITSDSALARTLSISNEDVNKAREAGRLYEFLTEKVGTLGEAGDTFGVRWSSFQSALDKTLALATKPFFDELNNGLRDAGELLNNPDLATKVRELATATGMLIDASKGAGQSDSFRGILDALGMWQKIGNQVSGISSITGLVEGIRANARSQNAGDDMSKALGLIGNAERAGTPETQAKAREAIEAKIAEIKGRVMRGDLEATGHVKLTLQALEKSLAAWEQIAGRSAEVQATTERTVAPTKEQASALEKAAIAAERASAAVDASLAARGDRVASPEERLGRMSERMQDLRANLDRDYLRAGGAGSLEGLDFESAARQINRGGVNDTDRTALLETLREILDLEQEITKEANDQFEKAKDALKTEEERQAKAAEKLADLQDELAIQTQVTAGNETAAELLEIQRNLRKELAEISKSDLAPAEKERAADLAKQTAELQKQKTLAEQMRAQDEARDKASDFVNDAKPGFDPKLRGSKGKRAREADRAQYLRDFDKEVAKDLRESGIDEATIDKMRSEAGREYDQKAREKLGRVGGSSTSPSSRALGKTSDDAWGALFGKKTAGVATGEMMGPAYDPYASVMANAEILNRRADENIANMQVPMPNLGDALPQPGGNQAGNVGADAANATNGAADKLQEAGDANKEAGEKLTTAGETLLASAEVMAAAPAKFDAASAKMTSAAEAMATAAENLTTKLAAIESRLSSAGY